MSARRWSRRLHKWLALLVGAQLLVWAVSGFYMVTVPIDIIHGDMLVKSTVSQLGNRVDEVLPVPALLARYPDTTAFTLFARGGQPVYRLRRDAGPLVVDAIDGAPLDALSGDEAAAVARAHYAGTAEVTRTTLIESEPPTEIQFASLPLWRVDFADAWGTSFYIDPGSGRFVTRRHTLWRVFDFLWMLHIIDYDTREDVNNTPLRVLAGGALLLAFTGSWLVYLRFVPRRRRA